MRNRFERVLKRLSGVHSDSQSAITFYFFPQTPQNKAHREQAIFLKDLIREAKKRAETKGNRQLIDNIERLSIRCETLARDGSQPLVIFASNDHGIWEEVPIPGATGRTALHVNHRFHLRPLAMAGAKERNALAVLADRIKVRFVRHSDGKFEEFDSILSDLPRKTRTDGFGGYDAGHNERHVENWEMRHFKEAADKMKVLCEGDSFDDVVIACRAEVRPDIEPHLHSYVSGKLLGYVDGDPSMLGETRLKEELDRLRTEQANGEEQGIVRDVLGEAKRNGRGTLGLRNVLNSLERGEIQTLVIGQDFDSRAIECTNCGHLDLREATACPLCSQPVREIEDIADLLTARAINMNVGLQFVNDDEFRKGGNIGALLRFRADQNTPAKMAG
jgi:peptide subunit release factor 1 (eRF1)